MKSLIRSAIVCSDYSKTYPRITHGKGVYLYDTDGKSYIDASGGSAAASNIGHGISEIADLMREQTLQASLLPTHAFSSPVVEDYLDALVAFAPPGFEKAWTVSSGTEAVENAVKLALQYHRLMGDHKRYKIIGRHTSYHGNSIFMLDVGGMPLRKKVYNEWMHHFPHVSAANTYRKPAGLSDAAYVEMLADEFERTLLEEDPATCAAFIAEPVVGAAMGSVPAPPGYFERMHGVCKKYGLLFIADEVMTGFGRIGTRFGMEKFNVLPDIIAAGKGITSGYYPMSAIIATAEVMAPFVEQNAYFLGGHTYACNPLGAAVGHFVIDYIDQHKLVANADVQGKYLKGLLERLYRYDIVGDVRGEGLLLGVELVKDKITKEPFAPELNISKRIGELALQEGVVLYPGKGSRDGYTGDHILIAPPLIISQSQCDTIADVLELSIRKVISSLLLTTK